MDSTDCSKKNATDPKKENVQSSTNKNIYICTFCKTFFVKKSDIDCHIKTIHKNSINLKKSVDSTTTKKENVFTSTAKNIYLCTLPKATFTNKSNTKTVVHKNIINSKKSTDSTNSKEENIRVSTTSTIKKIYTCELCKKTFVNKSNLNCHTKKIHKNFVTLKKPTLSCPLCPDRFITYDELDKHLSCHDITIKQEMVKFKSLEDFQKWKQGFEQSTLSSFIILNSRNISNKKVTKYVCHRSGTYKVQLKKSTRQNQLKAKGTNKIGSHCPARITTIKEKNGFVKVQYISTHVGHAPEVGRLRMTQAERAEIAEKLFQGIPNRFILQDIREKFDPLKKISYVTNQDLHNIKKSFGVQSDVTVTKSTDIDKNTTFTTSTILTSTVVPTIGPLNKILERNSNKLNEFKSNGPVNPKFPSFKKNEETSKNKISSNDDIINDNEDDTEYEGTSDQHQQTSTNILESEKLRVVNKLHALITLIANCNSLEAVRYAAKNISSLASDIRAIELENKECKIVSEENHSCNKKIKCQISV